jgi:metal-responsive CopG/Arc/MetJ family transcriptional regulator
MSVSAITSKKKKLVVDVPKALFDETEIATRELHTTTSDIVRKALEQYLLGRRQKKLEQELEAGYLANAASARRVNEEWSAADAEIA